MEKGSDVVGLKVESSQEEVDGKAEFFLEEEIADQFDLATCNEERKELSVV